MPNRVSGRKGVEVGVRRDKVSPSPSGYLVHPFSSHFRHNLPWLYTVHFPLHHSHVIVHLLHPRSYILQPHPGLHDNAHSTLSHSPDDRCVTRHIRSFSSQRLRGATQKKSKAHRSLWQRQIRRDGHNKHVGGAMQNRDDPMTSLDLSLLTALALLSSARLLSSAHSVHTRH